MRQTGWLLPMRLAGRNFKPFGFASVPVFHIQNVSTQDYGYTMKMVHDANGWPRQAGGEAVALGSCRDDVVASLASFQYYGSGRLNVRNFSNFEDTVAALAPDITRVKTSRNCRIHGALNDGPAIRKERHLELLLPEFEDKLVMTNPAVRLQALAHVT